MSARYVELTDPNEVLRPDDEMNRRVVGVDLQDDGEVAGWIGVNVGPHWAGRTVRESFPRTFIFRRRVENASYQPSAAGETASLREITLGHKHDGGTGITNFPEEQAAIYREAIRLHGDASLVVDERDYMGGHDGYFSLHDLSTERAPYGDLSPFWRVYDLVKALYETRRIFGVESCGAAEWVRYRNAYDSDQRKIAALVEAGKEMEDVLLRAGVNGAAQAVAQFRAALALAKEGQT